MNVRQFDFNGGGQVIVPICRDVTRTLIEGGQCLFIYSCYARQISFKINSNSKKVRRAEHEYMNKYPLPPISVLVTSLPILYTVHWIMLTYGVTQVVNARNFICRICSFGINGKFYFFKVIIQNFLKMVFIKDTTLCFKQNHPAFYQ